MHFVTECITKHNFHLRHYRSESGQCHFQKSYLCLQVSSKFKEDEQRVINVMFHVA